MSEVVSEALKLYEEQDYSGFKRKAESLLELGRIDARIAMFLANLYFSEGSMKEAEKIYTELCRADPGNMMFHRNLSVVFRKLGQRKDAEKQLLLALSIQPDDEFINDELAQFYVESSRLEAAEKIYLEKLHESKDQNVLINFAVLEKKLGKHDAAETIYGKVMELNPSNVKAWNNLGNLYRGKGQNRKALEHFSRATELDPAFLEARLNLAVLLHESFDDKLAESHALACIELNPDFVQAYKLLSSIALRKHAPEDARNIWRRAGNAGLSDALVLLELAKIEVRLRNYREATILLEKSQQDVELPRSLLLSGICYLETGQYEKSLACLEKILHRDPDHVAAINNLANVYKELGELDRCLELSRRALEKDENNKVAISSYLFNSNYLGSLDEDDFFAMTKELGRRLSLQARPKFSHESGAREILTIGFLSGDLYRHPVGYFMESLLANLRDDKLRLVAFTTSSMQDELTERLKRHFETWINLEPLDDYWAAHRISVERIDVLIDLGGYTRGGRPGILAYKPAPIQCAYLGYSATSGMPEMDFIIADSVVLPAAEERFFTEKVLRLPYCHYCFTEPDEKVEIAEAPVLRNGFVTFGCFNSLNKVNDSVLNVWSRILEKIEGSRLLLKAPQLVDAMVTSRVSQKLKERGIADRVILEGPVDRASYLESYNRIDIALDTFPYSGGTVSMESCWMGVPVLMRSGRRFYGRNGESIARQLGLEEWIADDESAYIEQAVRFASDRDRLLEIRKNLRARMRNSNLMDGVSFARDFRSLLQSMRERISEKPVQD